MNDKGEYSYQEIRLARAALTRLFEPSDLVGFALVQHAGPVMALRIATGQDKAGGEDEGAVREVLEQAGAASGWGGLAESRERWGTRKKDLAPERDLEVIRRLGGGFVIPEDTEWPAALADLGLTEPLALWVRSAGPGFPQQHRCISIVGSRDATSYGAGVTGELAYSLVQRGFTVISGGAYGIDAHAHRSALAAASGFAESGGHIPTIAVMAGGLDRFYPAGNEDLLRAVASQGALIAEVPPGSNPTRYRFLQRNRIIAALSAVTVVVEARWRSGALNTAHHANMLSREVGAVPGSVHSANSAGCHRLLREGAAVCVTDAGDVAELAGEMGTSLVPEAEGSRAMHDGLSVEDLLLLDALPVVTFTTVDKLTSVAGLSLPSVLSGLGRLDAVGLAESTSGTWRKKKT
ncbi:MAG: DNA-protecting protein DprA [Acidobacteria bacterium]|nr:DNA-protecting protein DprA [Acidobacteriota bacterium]